MNTLGMIALAAGLAMGLGAIGAGLGLGKAVAASMDAAGRQPEALEKLQVMMIIGAAMIEAIAIYCLVVAFLLIFSIPSLGPLMSQIVK